MQGRRREPGREGQNMFYRRVASPTLSPPAAAATGSRMQWARAAMSKRSLYQQHTGSPHQIQTQQEDTPGLHHLFKTHINMQEGSKIICWYITTSEEIYMVISCLTVAYAQFPKCTQCLFQHVGQGLDKLQPFTL